MNEDFEDVPESEQDVDGLYYEDWAEFEHDCMLERQELEDFEGLNGWNEDYNDGF